MLSRNIFRNPPAEYRLIPFWFWNSKMRKEDIESQIRDFHEKGIGGFFVHARFGLETPYLSREWMDCIRHAVAIAAELDMEVWLYDENGFPSGVGDLQVSRIPEYRSKFVDLTEQEVGPGEQIELDLPPGEVMLAYAYPAGKPWDRQIDLMQDISGDRLIWKAPQGEWHVAVYSKRVLEDPNDVVFGVDYLNPEAMRYFFDLTLEPYAEALGEHFGSTIKGIFTDEPTLLPWHHDINWYGLRKHTRVVVWDDLIEREMAARVQMTAAQFLPHLFFDIDDSTPDVRRQFWSTVNWLYLRAFFDPYMQWCDEHNLKLTGHVLFEEGLYLNTDFQSDITELLSRMHIPGTDHLGEVTEVAYGGFANTVKHLTNLQGEKLVSSIAHFTGKEACISETYGCAGWGLSFDKMKWIADWQYSLGINMLCPHAVFYSIEGFRKSDAPPSENRMAGWKYYRGFADYIARLSYMLRAGRHVAKIALLYPLRQFWGSHVVGKEEEEDRVISDSFDLCASILPRLQRDYDILSEQALSTATVRSGKIAIGEEEYSVLIAPPHALEGDAMDVLREFIRTGGTWILPPVTRGEPEREQVDREIALVCNSMGTEAAQRMTEDIERLWPARQRHYLLHEGSSGAKIFATLAGTADPEGVARGLEGAIADSGAAADVRVRSEEGNPMPDIRYLHRRLDNTHIYFFINTSDRTAIAKIALTETGAVEEWDPETGETRPVNGAQLYEGELHITRMFAPYGSTIFVVDTNRPVQSRPAIACSRTELFTIPDDWDFHIEEPNALPLNRWDLHIRTHGGGSDYTYSASFSCSKVPKKLLLMLDDVEYRSSLMGGMNLVIRVNDREWHRPRFGWYLDRGFKTLNITEAIHQGDNSIGITIRHSAWSGQPHLLNAPAVLLGNFACDPESRTISALPDSITSGSWIPLGLPFFSGTGIYTVRIVLKEIPEGRLIIAADDVRDMVEFEINGHSAAVRLWQPWEADITGLLRIGDNVIRIKVTNSTINFLESHPKESGLMGRVRLLAERGQTID